MFLGLSKMNQRFQHDTDIYHLPFLQTATSTIKHKINSAFLCRFILSCLPVSSPEGKCSMPLHWCWVKRKQPSSSEHRVGSIRKTSIWTRMHSSRMRTVCWSSRLGGGGLPICLPGDVCPEGSAQGSVYLPHLPCLKEFLTHACENITFAQLHLRTVIRGSK